MDEFRGMNARGVTHLGNEEEESPIVLSCSYKCTIIVNGEGERAICVQLLLKCPLSILSVCLFCSV